MPPKLGPLGGLRKFWRGWACLETPNQKKKPHMLPFLGEYTHPKNQRYRCIASIVIVDQKVLQCDWTRAFWPTTCEAEFSQARSSHRKHGTAILGYF